MGIRHVTCASPGLPVWRPFLRQELCGEEGFAVCDFGNQHEMLGIHAKARKTRLLDGWNESETPELKDK